MITSTVPIISLSLNAEAFPVFSSLPPGDLPSSTKLVGSGSGSAATPQSYYFSDLAFAGGFQTTLTYVNYSPQSVTCTTTTFYSDSGAPLSIPFNQGTIASRTDILPPGGSVHDQTIASLAAPVTEGWAQASCTGPVQAGLLYRYYHPWVLTSIGSSRFAIGSSRRHEASVNHRDHSDRRIRHVRASRHELNGDRVRRILRRRSRPSSRLKFIIRRGQRWGTRSLRLGR